MKKTVRLYNLIFPIWLLWLLPMTWIVVLPVNLLIDFTVVYLTCRVRKHQDAGALTRKVIWKVWLMGFLADFIGTALMFLSNVIDFGAGTPAGQWWNQHIPAAICYNPFENIFAFLWVTACVAVTGVLLYVFNYHVCLKKALPDQAERKKIALSVAVFTAPYLFYLPTSWFY